MIFQTLDGAITWPTKSLILLRFFLLRFLGKHHFLFSSRSLDASGSLVSGQTLDSLPEGLPMASSSHVLCPILGFMRALSCSGGFDEFLCNHGTPYVTIVVWRAKCCERHLNKSLSLCGLLKCQRFTKWVGGMGGWRQTGPKLS